MMPQWMILIAVLIATAGIVVLSFAYYVFWLIIRSDFRKEFKKLFGILPTDEKVKAQIAIYQKMGKLAINYETLEKKLSSEKGTRRKKIKKRLKEAKIYFYRARRIAKFFRYIVSPRPDFYTNPID